MRWGWRRLVRDGRTLRQALQELQGIRLALERVADATERASGMRGGSFRGSLTRPPLSPLPDESSIQPEDRELLFHLDTIEKDLTRTLGRTPTLEELHSEAARRELV